MIKALVIASGVTLLGAGTVLAAGFGHTMVTTISMQTSEAIDNSAEVGDDDGFVNGGSNGLSPVPLPAAGWMLLAGIGGIVALRRRAKA